MPFPPPVPVWTRRRTVVTCPNGRVRLTHYRYEYARIMPSAEIRGISWVRCHETLKLTIFVEKLYVQLGGIRRKPASVGCFRSSTILGNQGIARFSFGNTIKIVGNSRFAGVKN